jgi:hypothetical protein
VITPPGFSNLLAFLDMNQQIKTFSIDFKKLKSTNKFVHTHGYTQNNSVSNTDKLQIVATESFSPVGKTPACNQNNVFMDRIKDELDGEGDKTFVTPMDKSRWTNQKVDISANGAGWFYTFCVKLPSSLSTTFSRQKCYSTHPPLVVSPYKIFIGLQRLLWR